MKMKRKANLEGSVGKTSWADIVKRGMVCPANSQSQSRPNVGSQVSDDKSEKTSIPSSGKFSLLTDGHHYICYHNHSFRQI